MNTQQASSHATYENNQTIRLKLCKTFQNHRNSPPGRFQRGSKPRSSRHLAGELGTMIPQEIIDKCCEGKRYCSDGKHILYKSRIDAQDLYLDRENGNIDVISSDGWTKVQ